MCSCGGRSDSEMFQKRNEKCVGKYLVVENDCILVLRTQYGLYVFL